MLPNPIPGLESKLQDPKQKGCGQVERLVGGVFFKSPLFPAFFFFSPPKSLVAKQA